MGGNTAANLAHLAAGVARRAYCRRDRDGDFTGRLYLHGGVIGGGGLGDWPSAGYQRFQTDVMVITVLLLIALVQIVQMSGDRLVKAMSRK